MYDQAFYDDSAREALPAHVFAPLLSRPTYSDDRAAAHGRCVIVRFTPGDATIYQILITPVGHQEAVVTLSNFRMVFGVPWHEGAYSDPSYLAGQVREVNALRTTIMAVAAVVNHARACCDAMLADDSDLRFATVATDGEDEF